MSTWLAIAEALRAMDPGEFQLWLEPLTAAVDEPGRLVLACPNAFHLA